MYFIISWICSKILTLTNFTKRTVLIYVEKIGIKLNLVPVVRWKANVSRILHFSRLIFLFPKEISQTKMRFHEKYLKQKARNKRNRVRNGTFIFEATNERRNKESRFPVSNPQTIVEAQKEK